MALAAGNNDGDVNQTAVFIATSLDTRLVTTVSGSDTVSDFKKKIMAEHLQCFPAIGNIIVHSLKVKRRGIFYHLSDYMLVKSAFGTTKGKWFVSADASSLEQDIDILQFNKHKVGDGLALPWVTHNDSINKHDNHVHGSLSIHPKTVPFDNQIVSNVDGNSCKDVSKNLEEDMLSDDKQLAVIKGMNSKKRARDVNNENLLNDPSECGLPVKKKRKTQRVKSIVKDSEEHIVLTNGDDKVKDGGVSINNENTFEYKSKDKELVGEKRYDLDQVAAVVPSSLEDVGRETVANVAMVAETNIQHGVCEREKENEPVQKTVMDNEIPSSLIRTSDCEREAVGLTIVGPQKRGSKRSTKHKAAEKDVSSTSFIKELHNINTDAIDSSQQDIGSHGQDSGGDLIHKHKEDTEFSMKQEPEVKLSERRKRVKKSSAKNKKETLVMHADDNLVGDVSSTVLALGKLHNINTDAIDSSQQDIVSHGQDSGGDLIHKHKEDTEFSMKQEPEVKLPERRKRVKKSSAKNKKETLVMHADDNLVGDVSSTVLAPILDEKIVVKSEVLETALIDDIKKNDEMIVKMEVSEPTKSYQNQACVENMEENSKNKLKDRSRRRKKDVEKTGLRNDETVVKQSNDADCVRNDDILMDNDAELLRTEKKLNEVKVEDIDDTLEKQNEKMDVVKKSTRKKKTKKYALRNEDESITKHVKVEISDNVKEGPQDRLFKHQSTEVELELKKSQNIDHHHHLEDISKNVTVSEASKVDNKVGEEEKNDKFSLTGPQDLLSTLQSTEVELESKKSQSIDHHNHLEDASKNVIVSEVSKVNNEVDITNDGSRELNLVDHFAPGDQPNKTASIDNQKDGKKLKKKTKDDSMNDGEKKNSKNEGLVKAKKNNKSSLMGPPDLLSKDQSTEVELESKKSQSIDHCHHLEDTSKNVTVSEVSKVNNEAGSHEINFMDYFAPGHQPDKTASIENWKDTKKPKKIISKSKNNKVATGPNIPNVDQIKTPRTTKNIDAESSSSSQSFRISFHNQKSNKQQSVVGPVKKVLPTANNLLKTPAKIFGDYDSDKTSADDHATVNSDSSTRTPSRNPSSSSSSGDSATSIYLKRNRSYAMKRKEDGGKNNMMSQNKLKKNMSMSDLLRSSSRFKKAKFTASQAEDTESQPVDFVPDSQPLA